MAEGVGMDTASGGQASRTVFLSYASQDAEIANTVCRELEGRGIRCWIAPRDVAPGALYADAIVRAINDAALLVIVLSQSAVESSHVGREIERAASKRKQIIALRIDAAPLSPEFEYFLSNSQWIDVAALGMPAALVKLIAAATTGFSGSSTTNPAHAVASPQIGKRSGGIPKRVVVAMVVVIVTVGAAVLAMRFWPSKHSDAHSPAIAQISDKSIAVLPFVDMSQKKDQEYFGDGMAEEVLDLLAKIPGLTVIGRTSSFQFKGKNEDLRTIGTKLNAAYVLEGSVRISGEQVRITAQLINTKTGAHEWSETYDRPIGDVLKLQDAIAATVAREMQLTVSVDATESHATPQDAEAYDFILRGRHAADRFDREGLDQATSNYKQALIHNPISGEAFAELAFVYYIQGTDGLLSPTLGLEQARQAAESALKLNPDNARAHYVLGKIHTVYDWDWSAAEREFALVAQLAPGSADASNGKARLFLALGQWGDALRQVNDALARDPLDANSFPVLAFAQWHLGHLKEAEAAARRTLEIRPTYRWGHYYLAIILLARGDANGALTELQQEMQENGKQAGLAMAYYALGKRANSDKALARMLDPHEHQYAFLIADVYAFRGQPDEAMLWLERAYVGKEPDLYYLKQELRQDSLVADPRFKAFLKKMNLPE